jgi:MoxR-like ATPase
MHYQQLFDTITQSLIERDEEVRAVLLALYSGEHVLFVGPPGCGKSYMLRLFAKAITGLNFFEIAFSGETDADEVFGHLDFEALRNTGRYTKITENFFPWCQLALFDEFYRAGGTIKDRLLHGMGPERQALIDGKQVKLDLISCVGASNTWPDEARDGASLDRWLIRRKIHPISPQGRSELRRAAFPAVSPVMMLSDLQAERAAAAKLVITPEAHRCLDEIDAALKAESIVTSERRTRLAMNVVRAAAYCDGATEVQPVHLECLADVMWDQPDDEGNAMAPANAKAPPIIVNIANPVGAKINLLLSDIKSVVNGATDDVTQAVAVKKLGSLVEDAKRLAVNGNGRASKCLGFVQVELAKMRCRVAGIDPETVSQFK